MKVAALYDIHGNLPALEAVLEEVSREGVDMLVVGGDVVPGPMPRECFDRLLDLVIPTQLIHGNCELALLEELAGNTPRGLGNIFGRPSRGVPTSFPTLKWMR